MLERFFGLVCAAAFRLGLDTFMEKRSICFLGRMQYVVR